MLGSALSFIFKDETELFLWDKQDIDITRGEEVRGKIETLKPTYIINAAAYTDVDGAETGHLQQGAGF